MTRRFRALLATTGLLLGLTTGGVSGVGSAADAAPPNDGPWCVGAAGATDTAPPPCIISASVDGAAVQESNANWFIRFDDYDTSDGSTFLAWYSRNNLPNSGSGPDLGDTSRTFVVTVDTGSFVPTYIQARGANISADRINKLGDYHVTITANPATVVDGNDCTTSYPPVCNTTASHEDNVVNAFIDDYSTTGFTAAQQALFYGTDNFSNIYESAPADVDTDSSGNKYIFTWFANPHFHTDGTTVFHGNAHLTIPAAALKYYYGVDDPSSLTSSSFDPTSGTGTVTYSVQPDGSVTVDVTGMTFSLQTVKLKAGVLVPTRPSNLSAKRTALHRGKLHYDAAKARGSKVRYYLAKCVSGGGDVVTGKSDAPPTVVTGLHADTAYGCKVRAHSRAGNGPWSSSDRMPRHP